MTKWKNRSRQGQSKRGRYDGKGTPGSIASCQRAGPVRGSSPWGAKEAKSAPGHGGGGARGRPAPPKARPLPLPARPRRSRKRGEGGSAKQTSESPGLGKPVVGPLRPAEPAVSAPRRGQGHGDSAPPAAGRSRARAGRAAPAAERAGLGPRLPAPLGLPSSGLRAGGESEARRSGAQRGCWGCRGWWRGVVGPAAVGRAVGSAKSCRKWRRPSGDAKGWTAQAPTGLGRNSEEAPGVSATWRRLQEWSRGAVRSRNERDF